MKELCFGYKGKDVTFREEDASCIVIRSRTPFGVNMILGRRTHPFPFRNRPKSSSSGQGLRDSSAPMNSKSVGTHRTSHRWSSQDLITLDGLPYVGQMFQREPDLFVATGFSKWGMTNGIAAGTLLEDQLTGRPNRFVERGSQLRQTVNQVISVYFLKRTSILPLNSRKGE